jgi:hypothetical protein
MSDERIVAKAEMLIRNPVTNVFEAFVDPGDHVQSVSAVWPAAVLRILRSRSSDDDALQSCVELRRIG